MPEQIGTFGILRIIRIKLDDARTGFAIPLGSDVRFVKIFDWSDAAAACQFEFNLRSGNARQLNKGHAIRTRIETFDVAFVTNTAQSGKWVDVAVSADPDFELELPGGGGVQEVDVTGQSGADPFNVNIDQVLAAALAVDNPLFAAMGYVDATADMIAAAALGNSTSYVTVHTVTASKKLLIDQFQIGINSGTTNVKWKITDGASDVVEYNSRPEGSAWKGWKGRILPAGYTIEVASTNAATYYAAQLEGREVDE
jgi:hypothetical protein